MTNMRINILGCAIDNLSMSETLERVGEIVRSGTPHQHVAVNADIVVKGHHNRAFREIINRSDLINADGMPVIWASRLLGCRLKERVAGIDLFERLIERAALEGWSVFLLGARQAVVKRLAAVLLERHPTLRIAGFRDGYWSHDETADVLAAIYHAKPQLLFVAMPSPRKEQFIALCQGAVGVPFAMGVGGTFDVVAGATKRAPVWMQRTGFEWFYRFMQEPRRMFRRYFIEDMYFFVLLARAWWRQRGGRGSGPGAVPAATKNPATGR
jgi:N-acetylglucosaminyldiphosphoundecaprenol N-acetyl-beta-D-mannosaminyltransferase